MKFFPVVLSGDGRGVYHMNDRSFIFLPVGSSLFNNLTIFKQPRDKLTLPDMAPLRPIASGTKQGDRQSADPLETDFEEEMLSGDKYFPCCEPILDRSEPISEEETPSDIPSVEVHRSKPDFPESQMPPKNDQSQPEAETKQPSSDPRPASKPRAIVSIVDRSFSIQIGDSIVYIRTTEKAIFSLIARKVTQGAVTDAVPWNELNKAYMTKRRRKADPELHPDKEEKEDSLDVATDKLRKAISRLNERLRKGLSRPKGERYIVAVRGQGAHLNPELDWEASDLLRSFFKDLSVYSHTTDPTIMDQQ